MVLILSDRPAEDFGPRLSAFVMTPRRFVTRADAAPAARGPSGPGAQVINLTADLSYMGLGYYASLLAEARGYRVLPSVETVAGLGRPGLWRLEGNALTVDLDRRMQALGIPTDGPVSLFCAFGLTDDIRFAALARLLFARVPLPTMRVQLRHSAAQGWSIAALVPVDAGRLTEAEEAVFQAGLARLLRGGARRTPVKPRRWALAILHDPQEALPPSGPAALKRFVKAGERAGLEVGLITRRHLKRLPTYDALFIRQTTNVDHHTFRFARTAESLGMPTIDDSLSILRCTNKVYLAETLATHGIPAPATVVLDRRRLAMAERQLGFPMVLKIPDGSFSRGVVKVEDTASLRETAHRLFRKTDLILAQAFVPTEFDWRVGVLDNQPLFVSQYMMSPRHWQIVRHRDDGSFAQGGFRTLPVESAPPEIVAVALRAAALMGNGLYGVDLKQTPDGPLVIEVNDNPNLDRGVEDKVLGDGLYRAVIETFVKRLAAAAFP